MNIEDIPIKSNEIVLDDIEMVNQTSKFDEQKILNTIIEELKPLSKESRNKIMHIVDIFYGLNFGTTQYVNIEQKSISQEPNKVSFSENRQVSAKEFILDKNPQTDVEKVACLAYFLTHFKDQPYFKTEDISKVNTEAAQRKFTNAAKAVNNATAYNYLVPATKGQKQLSAAGELFVEKLPDREAAKNVMASMRKRKQKSKKNTQLNSDE